MAIPWLDIKGLSLDRGNRRVLNGINAQLSGRSVGLVGANGAGKTTLIGAMLGVLHFHSGSLRVLDIDIPRGALQLRARAGVMAEQAGVFPGGSAVDAVSFAGTLNGLPYREALRRAHRTLDALGVGEERYRSTSEYSTGMRQKCKLAMSLVHDPELLILDEPTVGLDPGTRKQLLELIVELRDRGVRILLSTHIMQDAEVACDEMLLLDTGRVSFCGPTTSLLGRKEELLIARGNGIGDDFAAKLRAQDVAIEHVESGRIVLGSDREAVRKFWALAAQESIVVRSLNTQSRSLEEAVIELMEADHV